MTGWKEELQRSYDQTIGIAPREISIVPNDSLDRSSRPWQIQVGNCHSRSTTSLTEDEMRILHAELAKILEI